MRLTARQRQEAAQRCFRLVGPLCVTFVWTFCAVAYWSIWHYVFIPYMMYTGQSTLHIVTLVFFHYLVAMCLYCYYCAIRSDPGYVKPGYLPPEMEEGTVPFGNDRRQSLENEAGEDIEMQQISGEGNTTVSAVSTSARSKDKERVLDENETSDSETSSSEDESDQETAQLDKERKRKDQKGRNMEIVEETNFCQRCSAYRPPRAHHCRHCGRCVLRMDHHCPWVNNCVGHNNLKYFFLFLVYGACLGGVYLTMFGFRAFDMIQNSDQYSSNELWTNGVVMGIILWIGFAFTLNLAGMGFNMLSLIISNSTTIERMSMRARWYRRGRQQKRLRSRYDLGSKANLQQVLGSSMLAWLFPTPPETDGYHSPTYPNPNNEYELC